VLAARRDRLFLTLSRPSISPVAQAFPTNPVRDAALLRACELQPNMLPAQGWLYRLQKMRVRQQ